MKKTELLQLISLKKSKIYYFGEIIYWFNAIKCMYGSPVKFKQKRIPIGLKQFLNVDLNKKRKKIYVRCDVSRLYAVQSTVSEGGEEYHLDTGVSDKSR